MRILFHSNSPWAKTGYGQQTAVWAPRLASLGHDVAISGYMGMQHGHAEWQGIPVFAAGTEHALGMDVIGYYYEKWQADVVIALTDCWAMSARLMKLLRTVAWTPVDTDPLGRGISDFAAESGATLLAMSEFGKRVMGEAGIEAECIPHGIDTALFSPPPDRDALRAASGIPEGCFVIGINQANRSGLRKALPEQLAAFTRFHERHPDSRLLLHMAKNHPKGQDLPLLLDKLGVGEGAVYFPDQGVYAAGEIGMEEMPRWYGALDVLLGCAMAEGFGLPLLEAQACGTPVIATDGSAMSEVAAPGWLVKSQPFWVEERHQSWWQMPLIDGIDGALEEAWQFREEGLMERQRKLAREHALGYEADVILREKWAPYLAGIEASL